MSAVRILPVVYLGFVFLVSATAYGQSNNYPQGNAWSRNPNHPLYGDNQDNFVRTGSSNWEVDSTGYRRWVGDDAQREVPPVKPPADVVLPNGKKPYFSKSFFGSMDELKMEKGLRYTVDLYSMLNTPERVSFIAQSMSLSPAETEQLQRSAIELREALDKFPDGWVGNNIDSDHERLLSRRQSSLKKMEKILARKHMVALINHELENAWNSMSKYHSLVPPEGMDELRNTFYGSRVDQAGGAKKRPSQAKKPSSIRGGKGKAGAAAALGAVVIGAGSMSAEAEAADAQEVNSVEGCGSNRLCARIQAAKQETPNARQPQVSGAYSTAK